MANSTETMQYDPPGERRSGFGHHRMRVRRSPFASSTAETEPILSRTPSESITFSVLEGVVPPATAEESEQPPTRRLTQSELYPVRAAYSPEHVTALRLLTLAIGYSQRALNALRANDPIEADSDVQKMQVLLPELFCCRILGDGFGAIVNSILSALEALEGDTPNEQQIIAISTNLRVLKDKPFLTADEADDQIEKLESAGLTPYPTELLDFLSSD